MTRFAFRFIIGLSMMAIAAASESSNIKNVYDGVSELIGHYVNVFEGQGQQQRSPTKLKFAIVGLPRTGTGSLIEALNLLGYTTLHADEYVEISDLFAELADETNPLPMESFVRKVGERGFDAMYYWSYDFVEWAASSDDVKIILTVRDTPKKWAESYSSVGESWDTLWFSKPLIWWKPVAQIAPIVSKLFQDIHKNKDSGVGGFEKTYTDHIERVQKAVGDDNNDKLLIFNAKQGWEPLCQFLNLSRSSPSCPNDMPFPHANERSLLQLENSILWIITWIWPVFPLSFLYGLWIVFRAVLSHLNKKNTSTKKQS
jgi:hypothetical protein